MDPAPANPTSPTADHPHLSRDLSEAFTVLLTVRRRHARNPSEMARVGTVGYWTRLFEFRSEYHDPALRAVSAQSGNEVADLLNLGLLADLDAIAARVYESAPEEAPEDSQQAWGEGYLAAVEAMRAIQIRVNGEPVPAPQTVHDEVEP